MFNRNALLLVAGAAIFALDASAATAQDSTKTRRTTRSQQRIPIQKEASGEVSAPRVDTVTVYKTDTLRMMGRVDTLRLTGATVTVHDTVVQTITPTVRHIGGLYFGIGGGPELPYGSIRTVNEPGAMGQVNLGWQGLNSPLGIRVDGQYTQLADNADYDKMFGVDVPKAEIMRGNADLRLGLPFFTHTLGSSVLMSPYLLGGGSYIRFRGLRGKLDTEGGVSTAGSQGPQNAVIVGAATNSTPDTGWHDSAGWNAGVGLGFHAGKKEMFVETRWINFNRNSDKFKSAWSIPITFGVNFF